MKTIVLLTAVMLAGTLMWAAEAGSTGLLLKDCRLAARAIDNPKILDNDKVAKRAVFCVEYMAGFFDGYILAATTQASKICFPSKSSVEQLILVFTKWATEHPELLHEKRFGGLIKAFDAAWPCRTKKKKY